MRTSLEPQSVLHQLPVTDTPAPQSTVVHQLHTSPTPVPCCTQPDNLATTHSMNATRARLRHASALLVTSGEVLVSVFSVPSVGTFARSVLIAVIDPNPLVVSLWKHISSLLHLAASDC